MKGKTTDAKEKVAEKVEPSVEEKAEREVAKAEVEAKKLWVGLNEEWIQGMMWIVVVMNIYYQIYIVKC